VPDPMMIAKDAIVAVRRKAIQRERENNKRLQDEAKNQGQDVKPFQHREMELYEMLKQLEINRT
jgi:hypothetical protein